MGSASTDLYWIVLLPLLGAAINLIFGRWMSRGAVHVVAVAAVAAAFGVVLSTVAGPLWDLFTQRQQLLADGKRVELMQTLYTWIEVGDFRIDLAFRLDTLSAVMCLVITGVGTLIHIYSTGYMSDEPRYAAYFGYLNLFTGSMLILVLGANLPVMFIGWEGVGVCSFLLIGFWFTNTSYANAGRKAFVVNRIGDFAFLLGTFLLYWATQDLTTPGITSDLDFALFRQEEALAAVRQSFWGGERLAAAAGILLFIGACGKSAQIPLYVWLPDAMAGPTPVSALIHAATMVTAGVYMIARLSFFFAQSTTAMLVIATVGMLTAISAAFMAFAQTDLKKVLAYSTVSQLGFMFVGVGTGNWVPAIFHLATHAFFKAGLFLGAGSVMHAMSGSGDITKMGGLRRRLPITHATFLIYCLAIAGIVPFAGFFSKDELLAGAVGADHFEGWPWWYNEVLWAGLTVAALGTAVYMWRLYFVVFSGECRADEDTQAHIHESPPSMTVPLVVLAALTCVAGFIGMPHLFHGEGWMGVFHGLEAWLTPAVNQATAAHLSKTEILVFMGVALAIGVTGIGIAYVLYNGQRSAMVDRFTASEAGGSLYRASLNKLWVDEAYDHAFIRPFRWLARALFEFVDRFLIDGILVNGPATAVRVLGRLTRWVQNGQVQRYVVGIVLGAAVVFFWTSRSDRPGISYRRVPEGLELRAYPGSGISSTAALRWDLDNDGRWDFTPEATARINAARASGVAMDQIPVNPADYLSAPIVTRRLGEVNAVVRLELKDPVSGDTRVVSTTVRLDDAPAAGAAGAKEGQ